MYEIFMSLTSHVTILYILNLKNVECDDPHMIPTKEFIFQSFPTISIDEEMSLHNKATNLLKLQNI